MCACVCKCMCVCVCVGVLEETGKIKQEQKDVHVNEITRGKEIYLKSVCGQLANLTSQIG